MKATTKYVTDLDDPKRRVRVIEPYTPAWEREANALARSYCGIRPCARCGHPVHERYCCGTCGSTDPASGEA